MIKKSNQIHLTSPHEIKLQKTSSHSSQAFKFQQTPYLNINFKNISSLYVAFPYSFDEKHWSNQSHKQSQQMEAKFHYQLSEKLSARPLINSVDPIMNSIMILLSAQWPHTLVVEDCFHQSKALHQVLYPNATADLELVDQPPPTEGREKPPSNATVNTVNKTK